MIRKENLRKVLSYRDANLKSFSHPTRFCRVQQFLAFDPHSNQELGRRELEASLKPAHEPAVEPGT